MRLPQPAEAVAGLSADDEALPNLEAVIVCADTLETVADPEWRPAQLDMADPDIASTVTEIAENRVKWFDVHTDFQKRQFLDRDVNLRARLEGLLQGKGELASPELRLFAQAGLLSREPAKTDARLLFYENPWRGFDIVIGNPPYEALSKSLSTADRKRLAEDKLYRTIPGGDLYNLFCETALALANPRGGVVTVIVPLSISFGQNKQTLRDLFNRRSQSINLRHYGNRPDTVFGASPTVRAPENRQRATLLTATLGDGDNTKIETTALQSWFAGERRQCIQQRRTVSAPSNKSTVDTRISGQWLRVPTNETAALVDALSEQSRTILSYKYEGENGEAIAFPETAYQFLSSIPANSVSPRRETVFPVEDEETLCLLMATLNGHIGYGWWWMVGDGFHLKAVADHGFLKIPNTWAKSPSDAIALGKQLIEAIPECTTEWKQGGKVWKNVNFHLKPDLIEELDRLHIEALGLRVEPLLTHLKIMRSSSSWNYSP